MSSMLAIARPNPSPKKKGSAKMLRKLSGRRNPSSAKSLRDRLAKARKNGVVRGSSRRNPSSAKSLRDRLAKARKNGVVRGSSRRNPSASLKEAQGEIRKLKAKVRQARATAKQSGKAIDKRMLSRLEKQLSTQTSGLKSVAQKLRKLQSSLSGISRKVSTRKPTKRKASTKRKSTAKRKTTAKRKKATLGTLKTASSYSGYKRMKSGNKRKFSMAFNAQFKKARRLGKSPKVAHNEAVKAGRKAVRSNPASVGSVIRSTVSRSNPKRKRKVTKRKATRKTTRSRRSKSLSAQLPASKRALFNRKVKSETTRLKKKHKKASAKQIKVWAQLSAFSKVKAGRKNSAEVRDNPKRKRKVTKRKTTRSKRSKSLSAQLPASKRALFNKKVKSETARLKKKHKKASAKQIKVWAQLSAFSKVKASRKNGHCTTAVPNPRKKKRTVSRKRRRTTSKRKLVRAKRIKRNMSASAKRVLSNYGSHHVTATIKGKQTVVRAGTNSKAYKGAKRRGLTGKFRGLKGKKNTPSSLNLNSVRKVFGGDYSKSQLQEALNIWTGAIDGGHVRGVSKSMIRKTRRNPHKRVRKHTISAISNPAPMSVGLMRRMEARNNATMTAMDYGYGAGAFALGLYGSNLMSSFISAPQLLNVDRNDMNNKSANYIVSETLPLLLAGVASGHHLYKKIKGEAVDARTLSISTGVLAGSVLSVIGRTLAKGLGRMLGLQRVAEIPGDTLTFSESGNVSGYLVDNQNPTLGGLIEGNDDMSRLYGNHVGRYVQTTPSTGRYVQTTPSTGRYVQTTPSTGRYVQSVGGYRRMNGEHLGAMHHGDVHHMGGYLRGNPSHSENVGANVSFSPAVSAGDGNYNMDANTLLEDIKIYEPLTPAELQAEGLDHVSDTGEMYKVLRATPDVARQIVESNFGSLIGDSNVVRGAVLVLASIYDAPQNTLLTDRLRLDRAPELPKGASFGNAGGVFSRGIFNAIFPSIDNQPTFQEFGVKVGN